LRVSRPLGWAGKCASSVADPTGNGDAPDENFNKITEKFKEGGSSW
jgi:hypothetical protein